MTSQYKHLNHSTWDCKYHIVFIPKYCRKVLYINLRQRLGGVFHDLATRRESTVQEGHLMKDHAHMLISRPPKYSIVQVIEGQKLVWIAQNIAGKAKNFTGARFWARGYFVSTVGQNEELIRKYIRNQEVADKQLDQFSLI
ncbi:MAG: IS200/IS605 family transposase [Proteobacteria bacterium]|nr:IS200/IS605 family transposase [Pseudomonadota bacterium]